ncbi:MAG: c-type cytochrome, partial [Anaerolineae bacterium]|nr:c-type cytochrome [Anaerolineae bacterium]
MLLLVPIIGACTGIGGNPNVVGTLPPSSPAPEERGYPETQPDLALGAQIYAARCVDCHGLTGEGDGELVRTGQLANDPGNFRDPASVGAQRPSESYATITNGRIDRLMPPWRDELNEAERWAVALYTYTLHYTPEQIARGRDLYVENCAECHGAAGYGDGERATEFGGFAPDLTNLETMTSFSDDDLFVIISEGQGTDMVGLADILADDQRRDVAAYVRTFMLANSDAIGEQVPPQLAETAEPGALTTGLIRGQVANGSAGGIVPADLSLTLVYFGEDLQQTSIETTADSGGNYQFADVPISADLRYAVAVNYRERTFVSDIVAGTSQAATHDIPVTIYELTEDPGVITIDHMVAQVNAVGDSLEITQVFTLRNKSDRAYTTSQATSHGRTLSVVISLPPGSVIWGFPDNADRYVAIQEQFAVADTLPVLPGEDHVVAVVYIIPYENGAIIEQPLNYAFAGVARVLLRPESLRL